MSSSHSSIPAAVPDIVLPNSWHSDLAAVLERADPPGPTRHAESCQCDSCSPCPRCLWDRHPENLFPQGGDDTVISPPSRTRQEQETCIKCRILQLAVEGVQVELGPSDTVWFDEDGCTIMLEQQPNHGDVVNLDIFVTDDKESTFPWIPRGARTPPNDTSSSRSMAWSKDAIELCRKSHIHCGPASTTFLPTRLIDVRPQNADGDVVLRDGSSLPQGSRYCALSYCWGKFKPLCLTTKTTLRQRRAGIPWSSLPLTFQDAIRSSRSMGVDFLWIDSVCIIQGDENDWRQESGRMFQVYSNSYVTLVATHGADSRAGLYSVKHNRPPAKHIANLRYENSDKTWPLYVRKAHDNYYNWDNEELQGTFPLFQRAWCYQERLISPRTLLFMPGEMVFQCFGRVSCECGRDDAARGDVTSNNKHKHTLPRLKRGSDDLSLDISQIWWLIVATYCSLDITVQNDRLPAIAGVAEYVHQFRPGDRYLAGLWSDTLAKDLLWVVAHPIKDSASKAVTLATKIPSWSWASGSQARSVQGFVGDLEDPVQVREATCQYVSTSPYGIVESSRLVLQGRLWTFIFALERRDGSTWFFSSRSIFRFENPGHGRSIFDLDAQKRSHRMHLLSRFYLLKIGKKRSSQGDTDLTYYLILKSTSKSQDTYVRIGIFMPTKKSMLSVDGNKWENRSIDTVCTIK